MVKKPLWMTIYFLSVCSFLLLALGCAWAINDILQPAAAENVKAASKQKETISVPSGGLLLGLGDSLTRGIGDPGGQGYFGIVKTQLTLREKEPVSSVDLAVSGLTSDELRNQIKQPHVQNLIKSAKWIVMTIGSNDLFQSSGSLKKIDIEAAEKSRLNYQQNLTDILMEIRSYNPKATVFVFGIYNPFGDLPEANLASRLVTAWNSTISQTALRFDHVIVIPTFDLFALNPRKYLYSDHFHPNHLGYERMAERLWQVIQDQPEEWTVDGKTK
jgi:lysophospholipase L1-like esterase